jgi:hypothetical protein
MKNNLWLLLLKHLPNMSSIADISQHRAHAARNARIIKKVDFSRWFQRIPTQLSAL